MKFIDLKGFFIGGLVGILGSIAVLVLSTIISIGLFGNSEYEDAFTTPELIVLVITCSIGYLWSGFIISKLSKKAKLTTPVSASFIVFILAFFPARELPLWYMILIAILAPPFFYLGAKYHLSRLTS